MHIMAIRNRNTEMIGTAGSELKAYLAVLMANIADADQYDLIIKLTKTPADV